MGNNTGGEVFPKGKRIQKVLVIGKHNEGVSFIIEECSDSDRVDTWQGNNVKVKINSWQREILRIGKKSIRKIIDRRRKNLYEEKDKIYCVVDCVKRVHCCKPGHVGKS